jgi:hypothetical protein
MLYSFRTGVRKAEKAQEALLGFKDPSFGQFV